MYTIKRAADQIGISAATLRAWERRYAIVSPNRTEGGYRLYDDEHLRVLREMAQLVEEGQSPGLAAREVLRQQRASLSGPAMQPSLLAAPDSDVNGESREATAAELTERLILAASVLDATALSTVLDEMFAIANYEAVVGRYLFPALDALGGAWASGRVTVAGEHLASHAVMRRLSMVYEYAGNLGSGPRVLIGMGPHGRHELGLFAFAVAARRRGLATKYLGADLPVADWLSASSNPQVSAVVLAIPTVADVAATSEVVTALRESRPDLLIAVGGGEQHRAPEGVLPLGHEVGAAAKILVDAIDGGELSGQ